VCDHPDQLVEGIAAAGRLAPQECRAEAHRRFDAPVMAARYEAVYRNVIATTGGRRYRGPYPADALHAVPPPADPDHRDGHGRPGYGATWPGATGS
jgi:hypothetical protein